MGRLELFRKTYRLAIPAIIENVFASVLFVVDALMVAQLRNDAALGAVGLVGVVLWRMRAVAGCVQVGAGATIARRWGAGDTGTACRLFTHVALLGFCTGSVLLPLLALAREVFVMLRAEGETLGFATPYFQAVLVAIPLRISSINMAAAIRAAGDTRTPMVATIIINIINSVLNYVLIFGKFGAPALGVLGAGISTAVAMTVEFAILLSVGLRGVRPRRLFRAVVLERPVMEEEEIETTAPLYAPARPSAEVLRFDRAGFSLWMASHTPRILRISHPTFWEEVAISIGFFGFIGMIASLGEKALAAHTAITRLESFSYTAGFGVSLAAATLIGQALGSGSVRDARRSFGTCITLAVMLMGGAGIMFSLFPDWFLGWFASSRASGFLPLAMPLFLIAALEQPFIGITNVLAGGLRGAGMTVPPFVAQMVGVIGVRLCLGYYMAFPLGMGMEGIYWATVLDWILRCTVLGVIVWRGKWEKAEV